MLVDISQREHEFSLTTERLILRNYCSEDWKRVHIYAAVPAFSQYEMWGPNTEDDSKKFVADMVLQARTQPRFKFDLAICLKASELQIGGAGIRRKAEHSQVADLGWAINPEFQSQGFATEAARALIDFGFNKLNLSVIYASCDSRNVASYRVMQKVGMTCVGLLKNDKVSKGHMRDTYRYEILREPFSSRK